MSHCTTFHIRFADKELLTRSMENLGWQPGNVQWTEYEDDEQKAQGTGGTVLGELLTGKTDVAHILFQKSADGLVPEVESNVLSGRELEQYGAEMIRQLNEEYVKGAVTQMAADIVDAGGSASVREARSDTGVTFTVVLDEPDQSVTVSVDAEGRITEEVQGIRGSTCTDLTSELESALAGRKQRLNRSWSHEYDLAVEDRTIQVMKLRSRS